MPRIRRRLPAALLRHLGLRVAQREITARQLGLLAAWLDTHPEFPEGPCFKHFPEMIACGEGELIKTFLRPGQLPHGAEVP